MTGRAKIGFGEALSDLGTFASSEPAKRTTASLRETAAAAGFVSREASAEVGKGQRRHRTGRSAQINLKARPETIADFQAWALSHGLSLAEAFEAMVQKLSEAR